MCLWSCFRSTSPSIQAQSTDSRRVNLYRQSDTYKVLSHPQQRLSHHPGQAYLWAAQWTGWWARHTRNSEAHIQSACVCLVSVKECHLHRTPICHNHHRRLFPSAVVYIWQHAFVLAPLHPSSQICGKPKAGRAAAASRLSYRTEQAGIGVGCNVACRCAASVGRQKYISI